MFRYRETKSRAQADTIECSMAGMVTSIAWSAWFPRHLVERTSSVSALFSRAQCGPRPIIENEQCQSDRKRGLGRGNGLTTIELCAAIQARTPVNQYERLSVICREGGGAKPTVGKGGATTSTSAYQRPSTLFASLLREAHSWRWLHLLCACLRPVIGLFSTCYSNRHERLERPVDRA